MFGNPIDSIVKDLVKKAQKLRKVAVQQADEGKYHDFLAAQAAHNSERADRIAKKLEELVG